MVVVSGCDLPQRLTVVPLGALRLGADLVATAGSWQREGGTARFTPRFGATPGSVGVVLERREAAGTDAPRIAAADGPWRELARLTAPGGTTTAPPCGAATAPPGGAATAPPGTGATGPAPRTTAPAVVSIDPGGDWVPANLLRFRVAFSRAMAEGSAAGHVHLRDAGGEIIPGSLLEMPPELWDRERRHLTVLLEPGRIKRGLQPNVQAGPPLVEGSTVTLVVDRAFRDAAGAELSAGAERTFVVGPPVRSRVDPGLWRVSWPKTVGAQLVVRFDRPLDRILVERCLRVIDGSGHPVPGTCSVNGDASEWAFVPRAIEVPVDWRLVVETRLEDLAGNSVRRVFDRDLSDRADDGITAETVVLSRADSSDVSRP